MANIYELPPTEGIRSPIFIEVPHSESGEAYSSWLYNLEDTKMLSNQRRFAESIERIPIQPEHIRGNILIGGHAGLVNERVLICKSESRFSTLRNEVETVTLSEPDPVFPTQTGFETPVQFKILGQLPDLTKGAINDYDRALQRVLDELPQQLFDTILFFRVPNLEVQLKGELLPLIVKGLKPGGHFIGSGSFDSLGITLPPELRAREVIQLPKVDSSGLPFEEYNLGFILQRIVN